MPFGSKEKTWFLTALFFKEKCIFAQLFKSDFNIKRPQTGGLATPQIFAAAGPIQREQL
jgi:hypothetical protein